MAPVGGVEDRVVDRVEFGLDAVVFGEDDLLSVDAFKFVYDHKVP